MSTATSPGLTAGHISPSVPFSFLKWRINQSDLDASLCFGYQARENDMVLVSDLIGGETSTAFDFLAPHNANYCYSLIKDRLY